MLSHAIRRATEIVRKKPRKFFMVLTPFGWKRFLSLIDEPAPVDPRVAMETFNKSSESEFNSDAWQRVGALGHRRYESYEGYIDHQKQKLEDLKGKAYLKPDRIVELFLDRLKLVKQIPKHASVLCLGARTGEEVRAFISIGHFAIGIDLNPGPANEYVVTGDFQALNYANQSIDCVYTNALDHAFSPEKISKEVARVLKPNGIFIAEIIAGYDEGVVPGPFESLCWANAREFVDLLATHGGFRVETFFDLTPHGFHYLYLSVLRRA